MVCGVRCGVSMYVCIQKGSDSLKVISFHSNDIRYSRPHKITITIASSSTTT